MSAPQSSSLTPCTGTDRQSSLDPSPAAVASLTLSGPPLPNLGNRVLVPVSSVGGMITGATEQLGPGTRCKEAGPGTAAEGPAFSLGMVLSRDRRMAVSSACAGRVIRLLSSFAGAAVTKCHESGGLNNRNLFSHSPGPEIQNQDVSRGWFL